MAKYKAYPEYKESGVEWLGEVPLNWHIHSLKRAIDSCTNGVWGGEPDDKHDLIVLRVADFERQSFKISDLKLTTRSILPKDRGSRLLKKGDLLIEKSGGGDKTLVGCVVLFDKEYEAVTSNFVAKMSPRESYDSHFLTYAFSQLYAGKVNYPSIKQTTGIQNLDADAYLMEKFCFPPMHEQRNISCFLDHETAKIDNLIEKQQQLIELLKEKRQAVISHAVTKGLNPDVPMKDSGIEWLGEIPAHWTIPSLKYNISTRKGVAFKSSDFCDAGIRVVKASDIKKKTIISSDVFLPVCFSKEYPKAVLNFGDIVLSTVGSTPDVKNSAVGQLGYVPAELEGSLLNQNTVVFSSNSNMLEQFYLFLLLQTDIYRDHLDLHAHGTANQASLNVSDMLDFKYPCPSLSEQIEIVDYIQNCNSKFDVLETCSEEAIKYLQERRTALISAAVTGKIDVRDWVAPDSQDVEEPEEATA
ncbi:restriction endonuclease subunit S [Citrobacter portucalensis]|uniref:restriction endonuclease subunit S n=1 Tax=Citrobacter portucalensis TaxID=1639133 RepID=UPI0022699DD2|nr:restriction endonuclease subunit S [Citrobacter portucalensis]MCX8973907.1 restriction endonuclease subunit S [Citrobacter portucalensis]